MPVFCSRHTAPPVVSYDRKLDEAQTVKAGGVIILQVNIAGCPVPTIDWTLNDRPIDSSRNITIETTPDSSTLTVKKSTAANAGRYKVTAENEVGSDMAEFKVTVMDKPMAPQNIRVKEVSKDYVILEWEAPESDGGSDITTYLIEKRDASKTSWHSAGSVDSHTNKFRCTKLFEGTDYMFRVSAENKIGIGESVQVSEAITAKLPFGPPSPPRKVQVTDLNKTSCGLIWKEPEFDGGAPVTGYYVERQTGYTARWMKINKTPVEQPRLHVRDLVELNDYIFRVIAENDAGQSKPSEQTSKIVPKDPYSKPSAPGQPNVADVTKDTALLTWTEPKNDGNSPITNYIIEMKAAGDFSWTVANTRDNVTKSSYTVRGLKPSTEYEFRVSAENRSGQGPFSDSTSPVKFGKSWLSYHLCYCTMCQLK